MKFVPRELPVPPTPPGFVDAMLLMTRLHAPPLTMVKVIDAEAQIFRVTIQAIGRRVAQRLMVKILVGRSGQALVSEFPAAPLLMNGYASAQLDPYFVRQGEAIELSTWMTSAPRWWQRLADRFWDWFRPPQVRVMLTGVIRKKED